MKLINADVLKDFAYINKGNFNTVEGIREWIDNAPTVYPKQGEWIKSTCGYEARCTACNKGIILTNNWNFCPNCGAKMEGGAEE